MAGTALIGLDWGTSALRAYRIDRDGAIRERRRADRGILHVVGGAVEDALEDTVGDWLAEDPDVPVLAAGMITSRQGWVETPYLSCPADIDALAAALVPGRLRSGRTILFVGGLSTRGADGVPDVMRGEETQIAGALVEGNAPRLLLLPGTHAKWVRCEGETVTAFTTMMTGELYDLLRRYGILGRLMEGEAEDAAAFARGVRYGAGDDPAAGGLLHRLFSARSLGLFGELPPRGLASYLSGLLIGSELREGAQIHGAGEPVGLVGEAALVARYRTALDLLGRSCRVLPSDLAARGLFALARRAGLLARG